MDYTKTKSPNSFDEWLDKKIKDEINKELLPRFSSSEPKNTSKKVQSTKTKVKPVYREFQFSESGNLQSNEIELLRLFLTTEAPVRIICNSNIVEGVSLISENKTRTRSVDVSFSRIQTLFSSFAKEYGALYNYSEATSEVEYRKYSILFHIVGTHTLEIPQNRRQYLLSKFHASKFGTIYSEIQASPLWSEIKIYADTGIANAYYTPKLTTGYFHVATNMVQLSFRDSDFGKPLKYADIGFGDMSYYAIGAICLLLSQHLSKHHSSIISSGYISKCETDFDSSHLVHFSIKEQSSAKNTLPSW